MNILTRLFGKKIVDADSAALPINWRATILGDSVPDLLYALNDHSGHVREAAIGRAVTLQRAEFLPALAARLNDWVPQVRDTARSALITLLPVMPPAAMLAILPAIDQLRSALRHDHTEWLAAFEGKLLAQLAPDVMLNAVSGTDTKVARACFQLLHRHAVFGTADLILAAITSSRDIVVARHAAALIHLLPPEAQPALYQATLQSAFGVVRAIGLRGVLAGPASDDKRAIAMAHLFDRQSSERSVAISYLNAHQLDARAPYLEVLASGPAKASVLQICLIVLGGMRQREDAAAVRAFTTHASVGVRSAAYGAWLKLAPDDKDGIAAMALADDASSIKKLAMQFVSKHGAFIPFATACAHLSRPADWLRLMRLGANGGWDVVEAIVRIAASANDEIRQHLRTELELWMAKSASDYRPTLAQATFLRSETAGAVLAELAGRDVSGIVERELLVALEKRR